MGDLLFNPNGRIARNRFWQGMIILTVASVVVSSGAWLVHPSTGLLSYALIFCYICVYGKRLHDHGTSAWWVIGIWAVSLIIQVILMMIFMFVIAPSLMSPEQKDILQDVLELIEKNDTAEATKGIEILIEQMGGWIQRLGLALTVIVNLIMALIIGSLRTWPAENKHGPVPGDRADTFN